MDDKRAAITGGKYFTSDEAVSTLKGDNKLNFAEALKKDQPGSFE